MKLNLSITDTRTKPSRYGIGHNPEVEEYERISVTEATGDRSFLAGVLRAAADDIDPVMATAEATYAYNEVSS